MASEGTPRIDSFMAADYAASINGKLYVMGGGFDTIFAAAFPYSALFHFAGLLRVPWNDTNRRLALEGRAETVDGEDLGWRLDGELEAGRPPGQRGGDTVVVVAGPVGFTVEEPLGFVLKLRFAGDERAIALRVAPPPVGMPPPRPPAPEAPPR